MSQQPQSPVKDNTYALISVLQDSLENVWQLETYIQDAQQAGDAELTEWFSKIQENNRKAGEQGKQLLVQRLQK